MKPSTPPATPPAASDTIAGVFLSYMPISLQSQLTVECLHLRLKPLILGEFGWGDDVSVMVPMAREKTDLGEQDAGRVVNSRDGRRSATGASTIIMCVLLYSARNNTNMMIQCTVETRSQELRPIDRCLG
jgi:hypothetical protein